MAIASRTSRSSRISFKSVLFSLMALLLVIGLFFIPEIIQFKRAVSGTAKTAGEMKTFQTATVKTPADKKESQLSRIASLIDSGYLDRIKSDQHKDGKKPDEKKPEASTAVNTSAKVAAPEGERTIKAIDASLTWKALKSRDSKSSLNKAKDQIMDILTDIPVDLRGSRFALLNFANAIEQITSGGAEKTTPAPQALALLEKLYTTTVNEFLREGISQVAYKRFVGIDFGSVLNNASPLLSGSAVAFNPQLTLMKIGLTQKKQGKTEGTLIANIEGFVVGDDVVRIEIVSGGIRSNDVVPKKFDSIGYRRFTINRLELTGKLLLKVYDRTGRVFQKLYSIYPRAKIFENGKGRFLIPESVSEFDNRLDRYFTMQVSSPSDSSDLFMESSGFEKF